MQPLTYTERLHLEEEIRRLGNQSHESTEHLGARVFERLSSMQSRFGLLQPLARDGARLGNVLRGDGSPEEKQLASGALRYILAVTAPGSESEAEREAHLRAALYVSRIACQHLNGQAESESSYLPVRPSPEELDAAEALFLNYAETALHDDDALIAESRRICSRLTPFVGAGVFGRLLRNVAYLVTILEDSSSAPEPRSWARGGLSYLVREDDVIADHLGFIGLLDDAFILEIAVRFVDPPREPWVDLLDGLYREWPFLQRAIIHDDAGGGTPSEFLLVNAALTTRRLRGGEGSTKTALVLPHSGRLPVLLAAISALGRIEEWVFSGDTVPGFEIGSTVCLDNEFYARFGGFEQVQGEKGFWLEYWRPRAEDSWPRVFLRVEELNRLTPAAQRDRPRGPVASRPERGGGAISAIEHLLGLDYPAVLAGMGVAAIVVTPIGRARKAVKELHLTGHPLCESLPVGQLDLDGEWKLWSRRFGMEVPALAVVSDLDLAVSAIEELREEAPQATPLLMADLSTANAGRVGSLDLPAVADVPVLAVVSETQAGAIDWLSDAGYTFWEWGEKELREILPSPGASTGAGRPLALEEALVRRTHACDPVVTEVDLPAASSAHDHLGQIRALIRQREGGVPPALDAAVGMIRSIFFTLIRQIGPVRSSDEGRVREELSGIRSSVENSMFLTTDEVATLRAAADALETLCQDVGTRDQKLDALRRLTSNDPDLKVLVRGSDVVGQVQELLDHEHVLDLDRFRTPWAEGAVAIPGWFGRTRMSRLLSPPCGDPLHLILHDLERRWYDATLAMLRQGRAKRRATMDRQRVFPAVSGWSEAGEIEAPRTGERSDSGGSAEDLDWDDIVARRARAMTESGSERGEPECEAHLVLFRNGSHGFFTIDKRLLLVTHLVDGAEEEPVEEVKVQSLEPGDAVLVTETPERDLLRELADRELPAGVRDLARSWQLALRAYAEERGLSADQIATRLARLGCRRHPVTIMNWLESDEIIGPRSRRDIDRIAELTGSRELEESTERVQAAISAVRGAHLSAARKVGQQFVERLRAAIEAGKEIQTIPDVGEGVAMVRVEEVDPQTTVVPRSRVNRLLREDKRGDDAWW